MKNKVRKYLENHFITESFFFFFFCTFWHTVSADFTKPEVTKPFCVCHFHLSIGVQQVERFQYWTPLRYLETFIETFARKWLTAQSLGQEIWKVCFPKKIIRFISRCDWKDQNLWYIKAYIYAVASYTKKHGGCELCKFQTYEQEMCTVHDRLNFLYCCPTQVLWREKKITVLTR